MNQAQSILCVGLLACMVAAAVADRGPVDFYDCSQKEDGNYLHPSDCTKFMSCVARTYAYERDCPANLNYDPTTDRCDYPEVAGCHVEEVPNWCNGRPDGNYAHWDDCGLFISCVAGKHLYVRKCPAGLHYDPKSDRCDWPWAAGCESSATTTEEAVTTEEPNWCHGRPDGNYAHWENCGQFISCVGGKHLYVRDCPAGLHYDPKSDRCDWPWAAGCESSATTTEEPEVTEAPNWCHGRPDGNYAHWDNCGQFVSCVAGKYLYVRDCPAGLHYDPRSDRCDWPWAAGCESSATTTEEPETTEAPNWCAGRPDGNYPHWDNCGQFISCVAGKYLYVRDCPAGLHYDPRSDRCDWPWAAGCDNSASTTEEPIITTEAPNWCAGRPDGNYAHWDNCGQFISCVAGKYLYVRDCPAGLHYDPRSDRCDWPWAAGCDNSATTTEEPVITTEEPNWCAGRPDGNYAHWDNCGQFVSCVAGKYLYIRDCPAGLHYDPKSDRCDWPWAAGCESSATTTEEAVTTTEEPNWCHGRPDGNYAHWDDCGLFVSCVAGKYLYVRNCPAGLHYDPKSDRCDWPWAAECDSSATTTEKTTTTEEPNFCHGRPDGNYAHWEDCGLFVSCVAGKYLYIRKCPGGLHYDPRSDRCDWPWAAGCDSSATTTEEPKPFSCEGKPDGNYEDPTSCYRFIACVAQTYAYYMDCPSGLQYDAKRDRCDYDYIVGCSK